MTKNLPKVLDTIEDPDKVKLIVALLKDEPAEKQRYIFVVEHHKVSMALGFLKFEVFGNETTLFRLKVQQDISPRLDAPAPFPPLPAPQSQQFNWSTLEVGKKHYTVGLFDVEEEGLWKKIQKGIDACLEDGEVPFISSLIP
jgi:hypothetical protein